MYEPDYYEKTWARATAVVEWASEATFAQLLYLTFVCPIIGHIPEQMGFWLLRKGQPEPVVIYPRCKHCRISLGEAEWKK